MWTETFYQEAFKTVFEWEKANQALQNNLGNKEKALYECQQLERHLNNLFLSLNSYERSLLKNCLLP